MVFRLSWFEPFMFLLAVGCASGQPSIFHEPPDNTDFEGLCALTAKPLRSIRAAESSTSEKGSEQILSPQSQMVADTIGVLDVIREILSLEDRGADLDQAGQISLLEARQKLLHQIQSTVLEVESAAAEVRCEKERADQLADRLEARVNRNATILTVSAIVGGAVFGFASGGLFLAGASTAGSAVSIAGGVVETFLGILALNEEAHQRLQHKRNILGEIWNAPARPTILPVSVWRFLNHPVKEEPQQRSLRAILITRWQEDGRLGPAESDTERRRKELFFGPGGLYELQELRDRAAMLNLLEADINLMTQDLSLLVNEVLIERSHKRQ
jgi:hypothetical protein